MAASSITSVDRIARRVLERTGRLEIVQLGAFIGATSNDPLFALLKELAASPQQRRRVRAVLVEPVRPFFDTLLLNYADSIGMVILENVAIAETMALRPFWRLATDRLPHDVGLSDMLLQLGSLRADRTTALWDAHEAHDPEHAAQAPEMRRFLQERTVCDQVFTVTLPQLLTKHAMPHPDLLVMDVEGYEATILRTLDYVTFRPKIIVFEHVLLGTDAGSCVDLLRSHGYRVAAFAEDTLAIADEACARLSLDVPRSSPAVASPADSAGERPLGQARAAASDVPDAAIVRSDGTVSADPALRSAATTGDEAHCGGRRRHIPSCR